ncbi:MAG TPA: hypothetical protein VLH79_06790 [Chthonomonadales bacterium]|nr:hypothetical protein [Chthonomonadales bacterium]
MILSAPFPRVRRLVIASLVLLAAGCQATDTGRVSVPALPAWRAPAQSGIVTWEQVAAGVQQHAPGAQLVTSDATFTALSADFARELVAWTRVFLWHQNKEARGFRWTAESLDCDKFAKAFTLAAELAAARAGVHAQPLALRISVWQVSAFGGVPAMPAGQNGHALVALVTDAGILIVEPQSGTVATFADYPNRAEVWRVVIGG